jgi:5-formyltetrahydrofolate cyclo-ligase
MEKSQLRGTLLKKRQAMSKQEWRVHSDRICTLLTSSVMFTQARTILAYFSFRQEADLSPLFTDTRHRWGFPRCVGNSLYWHLWAPNEPLKTGTYGILEPHLEAPIIEPEQVDLILVPCVGCDYQGYRLGYGGGYYDRLLSSPEWAMKPTIGIVFNFAYLSELPIESWDKPLQAICTETQMVKKIQL